MATQSSVTEPNPNRVFEAFNAYQITAAMRAAVGLDVFTAIGEGNDTVAALVKRCRGTERGIRILCDYLTVIGFLIKRDRHYTLGSDAAAFLDRRSPKFQGSSSGFLTLPVTVAAFMNLAETIRTGRPAMAEGEGSISAGNPIWVEFARSMAPMSAPTAGEIARILDARAGRKWKVLDLAAGHGTFGVTLAKHNPNAEIFAQDWAPVLEVAAETARAAGVESRFRRLPGDAFEVEFGNGYDVVLITNFLHHYDPPTIEVLLRKVHAALAPNGVVATLDFVPNEDRVSPPRAASFSMMMLGMTPAGDVYTLPEYQQMFRNAGFPTTEMHELKPTGHGLLLSRP
jgi:2-polyprenyl-3-methyl-5-hydroxy-6-metoxy-1,4-benzoquinol methylase